MSPLSARPRVIATDRRNSPLALAAFVLIYVGILGLIVMPRDLFMSASATPVSGGPAAVLAGP